MCGAEPPKVLVVAGLPGVGKSTVLSLTKEALMKEGYAVEVLNYGDFMVRVLKEKGMIKSRDEIRKLSLTEQRKAQAVVAKEIRKYIDEQAGKYEGKTFICFIDTHVIIKTPTGLWPGMPEYVVKEIKPDSIILVEADPEEIVARQLRDKTRYRADYAKPELVKELMDLMRIYAIASATLVGASVNFIVNKEGKPDAAAEELAGIVRGL